MLDDVALGVAAAGARVLADGVDAGQRVVALVVGLAAGLDGREDVAAAVLGGVVAVGAGADHGAHGQRVRHQAAGRRPARLEDGAGVGAPDRLGTFD